MSQFWNQLKDRVQARGAQANSTIGIIGGADGPTAVLVSTKPDSWLGTLLGLLPWGTGIISAGLLLGWCHKDKKRLAADDPFYRWLRRWGGAGCCSSSGSVAGGQAYAGDPHARCHAAHSGGQRVQHRAVVQRGHTGMVSGGAVPPPRILNCILVPHRIIKAGVYPQNACGNTPAIF